MLNGGPRRVWTVCLSVLALGGCASPFVKVEKPQALRADAVTLQEATEMSLAKQQAYKEKIQELAKARRAYAYGLYGLGTALIGMGAAKVHSSAITGTAIGGGAMYGLSLMDTNALHAKIYEEGLRQLSCANAAVAPLHGQAVSDLEALMEELRVSRKGVAQHLGKALAAAETVGQVSGDIDAARASLESARAALVSADSVLTTRSIAGNLLRNTVLDIDDAVTKDIDASTVTVAEVPGMIARIPPGAKAFAAHAASGAGLRGGPHGGSPSLAAGRSPGLAEASTRLHVAMAALEEARDRVNAKAGEIRNAVASAGSLATCKYQTQIVALAVSPATLNFDEGDDGSKSRKLVITGGKSQNYTFTILGADAANFRFDNPLVIPAKALPAKPSSYQAEVRDGLEVQIVTINVTPKPATGAGNPGSAGGQASATGLSLDFMKALPPLTVASGAKVAILGATKRADGKYEVSYRVTSGTATPEEVAEAVAGNDTVKQRLGESPPIVAVAADGPHGGRLSAPRYGAAVQSLTRLEVDRLQRKLGLPCEKVDGRWGVQTQAALNRMRKAAGRSVSRQPDADEIRAILEQPDVTVDCPAKAYAAQPS